MNQYSYSSSSFLSTIMLIIVIYASIYNIYNFSFITSTKQISLHHCFHFFSSIYCICILLFTFWLLKHIFLLEWEIFQSICWGFYALLRLGTKIRREFVTGCDFFIGLSAFRSVFRNELRYEKFQEEFNFFNSIAKHAHFLHICQTWNLNSTIQDKRHYRENGKSEGERS